MAENDTPEDIVVVEEQTQFVVLAAVIAAISIAIPLSALLPWFSISIVDFSGFHSSGNSSSPWLLSLPPGYLLIVVGVIGLGVSYRIFKTRSQEFISTWWITIVSGGIFAAFLGLATSINIHRIVDSTISQGGSTATSTTPGMEDFSAAMEQLGKLLVGAFKVHESYGFWITIVASLALVACGVWMRLGEKFALVVPAASESVTDPASPPVLSERSLKSVSTPPNVISAVLILAAVVLLAIGIFKDPGKSSANADSKKESASVTTTTADPLIRARSDYDTLFVGTTADFTTRDSFKDSNGRIPWNVYPQYCAAVASLSRRIVANSSYITWPPQVSSEANAYLKAVGRDATIAETCAKLPGTATALSSLDTQLGANNTGLYQSDFKVALGIK